jgi:NADH-quinone oxidoreductase subunit A
MLEQYIPVVAMILVGLGFGVVSAKAHEWLGPRRPTREKESTYESGMPPVVAMLFILFDIEIVFMYPWAVSFHELGDFALAAMLLFITTLLVGYVYIVKKGALKWD